MHPHQIFSSNRRSHILGNLGSGIQCPDKCRILLTSRDVRRVPTCRNVESGLCWRIRADLELNTANRTSDGVRRTAAVVHPDHSVWHSWDNLGNDPELGMTFPKPSTCQRARTTRESAVCALSLEVLSDIQSVMLGNIHPRQLKENPVGALSQHALNSFSLCCVFLPQTALHHRVPVDCNSNPKHLLTPAS